MPDVKRVTKRLEVRLDASLAELSAEQAKVVADRWINQHEPNGHLWEHLTTRMGLQAAESWIVVYVQQAGESER